MTEEQITAIAKECGFDMTGRLLRFARLVLEAAKVPLAEETEALRITELHEVDQCLTNFVLVTTEDNAVRLVLAILRATTKGGDAVA